MELRPEEITKIIRSQIKNYENKIEVSETGVVILVGDGIAKASGLDKCMAGELLEFPDGSYGMAQNLEEETVSIVILGSDQGIKEGDIVKRTGKVVSVPVGKNLIGRVVNALGERIVAVLKQKNNSPKEVAQQVCIIYAVTRGYLTGIALDQVPEFEKRLEEHMDNRYPQVLEAIRSTGKLESDTEETLKKALDELVAQFTNA